jgi:hypothetical protein
MRRSGRFGTGVRFPPAPLIFCMGHQCDPVCSYLCVDMERPKQINHPDTMLRVHRRQYVLGPSPSLQADDWVCIRFGSLVISHCPDLRIDIVDDAESTPWALLGIAAHVVSESDIPIEQIKRSSTQAVPELRHDWTGRWLLISERRVQPDAGGFLGCFFGTDDDENMWASSSAALLGTLLSRKPHTKKLSYQHGMMWYPPPLAGLPGTNKLMPSQTLDPVSGEVAACRMMPPIQPERPADETLDELASTLTVACKNLCKQGDPLWIGLSAGVDSRVALAAAVNAGVNTKAFTWVAGRTSLADRILPSRLAASVGVEHIYLQAGKIDPRRIQLLVEHSATGPCQNDADPFLRGARDCLTGLCTGGQAFDIAKLLKRDKYPENIGDPRLTAETMCKLFLIPKRSFAADAFTEWLRWVKATPEAHFDWRDRYHPEQGSAGWQCMKEQVYDMHLLERFAIINSGRMYALLLSLPEDLRKDSAHQVELVRRLCPELAQFPMNPAPSALVGWPQAILRSLSNPRHRFNRLRHRTDRVVRRAHNWFLDRTN